MTKVRSNAQHSAQTRKSVHNSPFRKGSVREKACKFLREYRSLEEFNRWAKRVGANGSNLLRALRKSIYFEEHSSGLIRMQETIE